jgi:hypothetical protein
MAPGAFLSVVVDREFEVTPRAGEPRSFWVLGPDVDPPTVDGQLDPAHLPRSYESQQVPVELGVTHHTIVAEHLRTDPANVSSPGLPMQKPEAPFKPVWSPTSMPEDPYFNLFATRMTRLWPDSAETPGGTSG